MGKSLHQLHVDIVKQLQANGEPIANPAAPRSYLNEGGFCSGPDVYIKGRDFGTESFVSGSAIREKDGTYTICNDMLQYQRGPFTFDQLGLCDPVCWYENWNEIDRRKKAKIPIQKTCPHCGGVLS
jgi:hypothetical protein